MPECSRGHGDYVDYNNAGCPICNKAKGGEGIIPGTGPENDEVYATRHRYTPAERE